MVEIVSGALSAEDIIEFVVSEDPNQKCPGKLTSETCPASQLAILAIENLCGNEPVFIEGVDWRLHLYLGKHCTECEVMCVPATAPKNNDIRLSYLKVKESD